MQTEQPSASVDFEVGLPTQVLTGNGRQPEMQWMVMTHNGQDGSHSLTVDCSAQHPLEG